MEFDNYLASLLGKPLDLYLITITLLIIFLLEIMIGMWICFQNIELYSKETKSEIDQLKSETKRLKDLFDTSQANYISLKEKINDEHNFTISFIGDNRTEMLELNINCQRKINSLRDLMIQTLDRFKILESLMNALNSKLESNYKILDEQIVGLKEFSKTFFDSEVDLSKKISDVESKNICQTIDLKNQISSLKSQIDSSNEKIEHYYDSVEQLSLTVKNNISPEYLNKNIQKYLETLKKDPFA